MTSLDMTLQTRLDRFVQLMEGLRECRPRPEAQTAGFCAAALVHADMTVDAAIAATRTVHDDLAEGLGWRRTPNGAMRWLYAAMFAAQGVPASAFLTLKDRIKAQAREQGVRGIYEDGSRAALVLAMHPDGGDAHVDSFLALRDGLRPPWWRGNAAITDTFAAAHALGSMTSPDQVAEARERAIAVFAEDRQARSWKRDGARLTVLRGDSATSVLARFRDIETARRADRFLRGRSSRQLSMEWAAAGRSASDIAAISALTEALPRRLSATGYARARLAHMIAFGAESGDPAESATALAAVIAAQAAAMAAIIAASTAATSTATSS